MKKTICTMLALLMSVLLVFSLAACQDSSSDPATVPSSSSTQPTQPTVPPYMPESAAELLNKVYEASDALGSEEYESVVKIVYYQNGYECSLENNDLCISTEDAYYGAVESKNICKELSMEQTVTTVNAWYDGKMYFAQNDGTVDQKLCSVATRDQFKDTRTRTLRDEVDMTDCANGTFTKNGEDGWTMEFSGYSRKTIRSVLDFLQWDESMFGAEIEDMTHTVEADANFLVTRIEMSFVFAEEDGSVAPEFSWTSEYTKHGTATFEPELLKPEEYTQVDDLFILTTYAEEILARQNAAEGHFVLDITNTVKYYGQASTSKETDIVTYGKKNGAYYYSVSAEMDGSEFSLVYQNGTQVVTADGETYSDYMTDAEAKLTIDMLIDSALFDALSVTDIEKIDEGIYMLTCGNLDLDTYSTRVMEGITLDSGEQVIKIIFKDDKLVKVESTVNLKGKYDYNDIEMTIKSAVDFEKEADFPTV